MRSDRARVPATALRHAYGIALVVASAPFVVSGIAVLLDGSGGLIRDQALMELRVRDVGRHPVLFGLYSRGDWSHPGPILYYTLALPYRLTGGNPAGLLVGALAINAAAVGGMALIAKRLGGVPAALLTLVGASVVARALGTEMLRDPWVCYVTVLPFGLFCFLAWAMTAREAWALPAAALLASWLAQTHVGYAPLTIPIVIAGSSWLWIAARRTDEPAAVKRVLRAGAVAVLVVAVAWTPPVWDQVWRSGNLGKLVDWFARGNDGVHTFGDAARIVFGQFAALPDWLTGNRRSNDYNGETELRHITLFPVLLVPFLGASVIAWRRRDRAVACLAGIVGLMLVVSVVAVARTVGPMYEYRLFWTWMLGSLAAVVVVWTGWNIVTTWSPRAESTFLVPVALVMLAVLCTVEIVAVARADRPDIYSTVAEDATRQLTEELDPADGEVLLEAESPLGQWYLQGLVLGLERNGFDARVRSAQVVLFGEHRVASGAPVGARLLVLGDGDLDGFVPRDGFELVAYSGNVPLSERAERGRRIRAEQRGLLEALESGELSADAFESAYGALLRQGPSLAVFRENVGPE